VFISFWTVHARHDCCRRPLIIRNGVSFLYNVRYTSICIIRYHCRLWGTSPSVNVDLSFHYINVCWSGRRIMLLYWCRVNPTPAGHCRVACRHEGWPAAPHINLLRGASAGHQLTMPPRPCTCLIRAISVVSAILFVTFIAGIVWTMCTSFRDLH